MWQILGRLQRPLAAVAGPVMADALPPRSYEEALRLAVRDNVAGRRRRWAPAIESKSPLRSAAQSLSDSLSSAADLEYLLALPRDRLLTHTEVRLCAGVLRRLLVDDQLGRLWRSIRAPKGVELTVEVTDLDTPISKWPEHWIRYAWAGGASANDAHHVGLILAVIPKAEHEPYGSTEALLEAHPMPHATERRTMKVTSWLRSTSVAIQTNELGLVRISRRSVLTYVANRKGGVHFDPQRKLESRSKRRARREVESHLLDHGLLRVGHLSGPEFEVASLLHAVATTDWAAEIVRAAQEAAPEDFHGDPRELKWWTGMREADGTGWATSKFDPPPEPEG